MQMYNIKLNPTKCVFGVSLGKFLGFMVTQRRIKVNLEQIKGFLETPTSISEKELQCLTGRLAALGRFIAHFTNKPRSFFFTLNGASAIG